MGLAAACFSPSGAAQGGIGLAEAPSALKNAAGNYRLLVVCTADAAEDGIGDPPLMSAQYDSMQDNAAGYADRDLVLVWLSPTSILSWQPVFRSRDKNWVTVLISSVEGDPAGLRPKTGCDEVTDEVTLIGKDTGVKRVWQGLAPTEDVFAAID
ncbi:MAG: DUF4174 domain-containing protein, partial [Henriciella sp.]